MPVTELKTLKKVQGIAAGTAIQPGGARRGQMLCRGGPADVGITGKATVWARLNVAGVWHDDMGNLLGSQGCWSGWGETAWRLWNLSPKQKSNSNKSVPWIFSAMHITLCVCVIFVMDIKWNPDQGSDPWYRRVESWQWHFWMAHPMSVRQTGRKDQSSG